jgi:hypothetical protein|tara:strand:- start:899 stop:1075 length:177 start_codon:yes stop_codon:yes gene_type:complete
MVLKILPGLSCNQHKNDDLGRLEPGYRMNNAHISYKMPSFYRALMNKNPLQKVLLIRL